MLRDLVLIISSGGEGRVPVLNLPGEKSRKENKEMKEGTQHEDWGGDSKQKHKQVSKVMLLK